MNDGSRNGLREEWSLLVHSIIDDTTETKKIDKVNLQDLSLEQIKVVKRDLSNQRKNLNVKIESIKTRIEHLYTVIENLELVGSDPDEVKAEIDQLHQEGENIAAEMTALDIKLKKVHDLKDRLVLITDSASS